MPKLGQLTRDIGQRAQKLVDDAKAKLDVPMEKAWNDVTSSSKEAAADLRDDVAETVAHNADKEYKKELDEAKAKLTDVRDEFKETVTEELGLAKAEAEELHDEIVAFDAELEAEELVADITGTEILDI